GGDNSSHSALVGRQWLRRSNRPLAGSVPFDDRRFPVAMPDFDLLDLRFLEIQDFRSRLRIGFARLSFFRTIRPVQQSAESGQNGGCDQQTRELHGWFLSTFLTTLPPHAHTR